MILELIRALVPSFACPECLAGPIWSSIPRDRFKNQRGIGASWLGSKCHFIGDPTLHYRQHAGIHQVQLQG